MNRIRTVLAPDKVVLLDQIDCVNDPIPDEKRIRLLFSYGKATEMSQRNQDRTIQNREKNLFFTEAVPNEPTNLLLFIKNDPNSSLRRFFK